MSNSTRVKFREVRKPYSLDFVIEFARLLEACRVAKAQRIRVHAVDVGDEEILKKKSE
jgi:hypothetical protein